MFHPRAPNFRLSWTVECRKATAYSMGFHCATPLTSSRSWLTPCGGRSGEKQYHLSKHLYCLLLLCHYFCKILMLNVSYFELFLSHSCDHYHLLLGIQRTLLPEKSAKQISGEEGLAYLDQVPANLMR